VDTDEIDAARAELDAAVAAARAAGDPPAGAGVNRDAIITLKFGQ
jgi:hypothetical protein